MSMGPSTLDLPPPAPAEVRPPRGRIAAHALATEVARLHGDALMRTARRFAGDPDDAHDAYQRALELLLQHADTIDRAKALPWMHVVVRREASALRRRHERHLPLDIDALDRREAADRTDEAVRRIDLAQRASEALATLKESEAQALCLRAQGLSYEEIADECGWSYTKVNRAVSEGRRAFVDHYLGAEQGTVCRDASERLGAYLAGELRAREQVRVRAHLARCPACRAQLHAERDAGRALQALLPPALLAAPGHHGWLHDHLLAPTGDLLARLAPAGEHTLAAKLGVAAASSLAIAGGGLTIDQQLRETRPVPEVRTALSAAPPAAAPAQTSSGASAAGPLQGASIGTQAIIDDARARARAAARRAKARRAAEREREERRVAAAAREFAPATAEFTGGTGSSTRAARSADSPGGGSSGTTSAPPAAPVEVPTTEPTDSSVTVTEIP